MIDCLSADGHIQIAEVEVYGYKEDIKCYDSSGKEYRGGQSYTRVRPLLRSLVEN